LKKLEAACDTVVFNVVVLCTSVERRIKQAIASLLRERCPSLPIIEMFSGAPAVEGAIHFSGEPGPELISTLNAAVAQ
jgi:hypothetical protein